MLQVHFTLTRPAAINLGRHLQDVREGRAWTYEAYKLAETETKRMFLEEAQTLKYEDIVPSIKWKAKARPGKQGPRKANEKQRKWTKTAITATRIRDSRLRGPKFWSKESPDQRCDHGHILSVATMLPPCCERQEMSTQRTCSYPMG